MKKITDWCLKHAIEDLSNAYSNFFKPISGKRKGPKFDFPKFKSKSNQQSHRTRSMSVAFENNVVNLPKIKNDKVIFDKPFDGKMNHPVLKYGMIHGRSQCEWNVEEQETFKKDSRKRLVYSCQYDKIQIRKFRKIVPSNQ